MLFFFSLFKNNETDGQWDTYMDQVIFWQILSKYSKNSIQCKNDKLINAQRSELNSVKVIYQQHFA